MTTTPLRRRGLALAAAAAVAASTLLGTGQAAQAASPTPTHGATIDYFNGVYDGVGANSVFETVTLERFEYILKNKSGAFAFFIGDPDNSTSRATIGHINTVAKHLGIQKVYNFTPKLDGDSLNVWDLDESGLRELGRTYFGAVGDRLVADYLNKDTTPQFTKDEDTDPYLFVYDKDHTAGEEDEQDRIVASLAGTVSAADLDTTPEVEAYEDEVADVLGSVPVNEYATSSAYSFWKDEGNRRHTATYADAERYGGDVVTDADATDGWRVQPLTYPELEYLLQQPGDFPILFGGTWCHNTRAIVGAVNGDAQEHGIKTVYNFDFSLFSTSNGGSNYDHIRDNPAALEEDGVLKVARPSHLYGDLVNTYLPNAFTQYRTAADVAELGGSANAVSYYPGGDTTKELKQARKIQVGHVLTYNKDHKDAFGNAAPVVDQAIRQNDDGGHTEHMTEWWYVKGRDLEAGNPLYRGTSNPASESGSNSLQSQRAFAKEALGEIDTVLGGLAGESAASTTSVTGLGGAEDPVPALGSTPQVTVSVAAPEYSPFISLNTASASTAPNNTTGKPRGFVALYKGDDQLSRARLKRDGTATLTLPVQTAGQKSYTVTYSGRGEAIAPSSKVLELNVPGTASETTLDAPSALTFGAGGTATATVTAAATGKVSLAGLPGAPIEADVVDGTATFAIPATTPAGAHQLVATYKGDDTYGSSSSAASPLTVSKAASSLTVTPTGAAYGKNAKVAVQVDGPGDYVPTGKVSITLAGQPAKDVTLDDQGTATLTLTKTLAPKTYAVTAVYGGSGNLIASVKSSSITIGKGAVSKVAYAKTKTPTSKKTGKATITVTRPSGLATPTGKVTVSIKKGSSTKTVKATLLSGGKKSITLPKLKKGTWKVTVSYAGDTRYAAKKSSTYTLKITK